ITKTQLWQTLGPERHRRQRHVSDLVPSATMRLWAEVAFDISPCLSILAEEWTPEASRGRC
ncbi:MAG: hypothetical protein ABIK43_00450, partial [candidate division WOR-3 bacterium]